MKAAVLPFLAVTSLAGSGGGSQRSGAAPTITMQPAPASAPVGSTATYLVGATGDATLTYQWKLNGSPIAGATTSTYTTPVLAAQDASDAFSVTVSNASGSATSNSVGLTLGPRSPKQGDFRFKLVGLVTNTGTFGRGNIDSNTSYNSGSQLGTSLSVGSAGTCAAPPLGTCSWLYDVYNSPTNITQTSAVYVSGQSANLFADLSRNATSANILTAFR